MPHAGPHPCTGKDGAAGGCCNTSRGVAAEAPPVGDDVARAWQCGRGTAGPGKLASLGNWWTEPLTAPCSHLKKGGLSLPDSCTSCPPCSHGRLARCRDALPAADILTALHRPAPHQAQVQALHTSQCITALDVARLSEVRRGAVQGREPQDEGRARGCGDGTLLSRGKGAPSLLHGPCVWCACLCRRFLSKLRLVCPVGRALSPAQADAKAAGMPLRLLAAVRQLVGHLGPTGAGGTGESILLPQPEPAPVPPRQQHQQGQPCWPIGATAPWEVPLDPDIMRRRCPDRGRRGLGPVLAAPGLGIHGGQGATTQAKAKASRGRGNPYSIKQVSTG